MKLFEMGSKVTVGKSYKFGTVSQVEFVWLAKRYFDYSEMGYEKVEYQNGFDAKV